MKIAGAAIENTGFIYKQWTPAFAGATLTVIPAKSLP